MRNRNKIIILAYVFALLAISSFNIGRVQINTNENVLKNLRGSGYWEIHFIHIDGNWTDTAITYEWCSGDGSWNNPYVIEDVIINASSSPTGHGIFINNSRNEFFIIRNCTVFRMGDGIRLEQTDSGTLLNNTCTSNYRGISLFYSCNNNSILNNTVNYNSLAGVNLRYSCKDNSVVGNTAENCEFGILLETNCTSNIISENTANNNNRYGIAVSDNQNNRILDNTANNNIRDGIAIVFCDNIQISRNTANTNGQSGIELDHVKNNFISENIISNNDDDGIDLYSCENNTFLENTINNNSRYGIVFTRFSDSNDNYLIGNDIHNHLRGLVIESGRDNIIYLNNFSGNVINVYDTVGSQYDNGTIGNYWDDYDGVDADDDGIGDSPYRFYIDYYPIWDDGPHVIAINSPKLGDFFNAQAPSFNLSINYPFFDSSWYTLDYGLTNYSFTGPSGTINQTAWDAYGEGSVPIKFYVNNTAGNFTSAEVIVVKDTITPKITISSPLMNSIFGELAPAYDISIEEVNFDKVWYTIDGGLTNFTFTNRIGIIDQNNWSATPNGHVIIRFYAMDLAGNVGFKDVIVIKDAPDNLICIDIIDLFFSTDEFVVTFFIYDENDQGIGFALIQLWWDGIDVSHNIVNIGNGFYFVSLEPITVTPEEDPILFNMIISADGYQNKYFETYIAVDPESIDKDNYTPSDQFSLPVTVLSIVGGIGLISVLTIVLLRWKRK